MGGITKFHCARESPPTPIRTYMNWYWNITVRWVLYAPKAAPTAYAPSAPNMRAFVDLALHNYVQCSQTSVPPESIFTKIKKKIISTLKCTGCINEEAEIEDMIRSSPEYAAMYQVQGTHDAEAGGSSQQAPRTSQHEIEEHGPTQTQRRAQRRAQQEEVEEVEEEEEAAEEESEEEYMAHAEERPRKPTKKRRQGSTAPGSSQARGRRGRGRARRGGG